MMYEVSKVLYNISYSNKILEARAANNVLVFLDNGLKAIPQVNIHEKVWFAFMLLSKITKTFLVYSPHF